MMLPIVVALVIALQGFLRHFHQGSFEHDGKRELYLTVIVFGLAVAPTSRKSAWCWAIKDQTSTWCTHQIIASHLQSTSAQFRFEICRDDFIFRNPYLPLEPHSSSSRSILDKILFADLRSQSLEK
ncbi:MAG: hypothetical protein CL912_28370 [Deltaproteobacteria bacterium]|nr:hypothetical protein [Deltaproteobacteria bacterium]